MPYQPTNPYPYNTAIDLDEGLEFRFKADNYDVINSFEIELYDLLKNKKLYTINRCIGDIQDNKIIKGTKQLLQIFDENEEQIYLNEFSDSESSILPLKSKRNNLNLGILNLSGYLATIEQIEKRKYYSEVDNAENLTLTKAEAFEVNENGVIISYNPSVLSDEEKKKIVIPYELPFIKQEVTQKIKVTGIADNIFAKDKNVEEVIIPSCVVFVGESDQANQKEILGTFYQAENLKRVVLNYGTSKIGKDCFWGCTNLTEFNFIDSISEIGENVFRECKKLLVVNCPTDLKIIPRSAFENSGVMNLFLSKNTQRIEARAFKNCGNLTQLKTYPQLELIGDSSFQDTGLKEVELAEGLKHCEGAAFSGCPFTTITLPASLESLGVITFAGCDNLEELTTPLWSTDPFYLLFSGKEANVPNSLKRVTIIETEEIADEGFKNLKNIQEINIAEGLKKIGEKCFMGCNQLIKFVCPSTLETIGASAFAFEKEKTNTETSSSTEGNVSKADLFTIDFSKIDSSHTFSIGQNVFQNRENIKEIVLPSFTSEIGIGAFYNCFKSSLEEVILKMPLLKSESVENEKMRGFKRYFVNTDDANLTPLFPKNLKKVTISQVVGNQIEDKAFCFSETEFLSSIENIELPDSVTKIGEKAFYNIKFSTFNMPFNIIDIGQNAFNFSEDCDFYWTTLLDCKSNLVTNTLNTKEKLFGAELGSCYGNKGVVEATEQQNASIYNFQGGETYDGNNKQILLNEKVVANYSAPACFFGIGQVTTVSGQCGKNLRYEIKGQSLVIQGYGDMYDYQINNSQVVNTPWFGNRDKIKKISLPQGITKIGNYAFSGFSVFNEIDFEQSQVNLIIGDYAFQDCVGLTKLSLPERVSNIGKNILQGCYTIKRIEFPSISENNVNFKNLGYLWKTEKGKFSYDQTKWLQNYYTNEEQEDYYYCIPCSLKEVVISKKLKNFSLSTPNLKLDYVCLLDEQGSVNCLKTSIATLELRLSENYTVSNIIGVSDYANGYGVSNLIVHSKYAFPESSYLIRNCSVAGILDLRDTIYTSSDLTKLFLFRNNNVSKDSAPSSMPHTLLLPDTCEYLTYPIICNLDGYYDYEQEKYVSNSLKHVAGNNISEIEDCTFEDSIIETLEFPELTRVGARAFFNCTKLKQFTKGEEEGVIKIKGHYIAAQAFVNCINLKKVKVSFVKYENYTWYDNLNINAEAFVGCENLEDIECEQTFCLNGEYNFANCKKLKFNHNFIFGSVPYDASNAFVVGTGAFLNCKEFVWDNSLIKKFSDNSPSSTANFRWMDKIPHFCFFGCEKLLQKYNGKLNIGNGVEEIGNYAFAGTEIKDLKFYNTQNISYVGIGAFMGFLGTKITLPFIGITPTISQEKSLYETGGMFRSSCLCVFGAFSGSYKDTNNEKSWYSIHPYNLGCRIYSYTVCRIRANSSQSWSNRYNCIEVDEVQKWVQELADNLASEGKIIKTCINGYETNLRTSLMGYDVRGGYPIYLEEVAYTQSPSVLNAEAFRNCVCLKKIIFPQKISNISTAYFGPFHNTLRSLSFEEQQSIPTQSGDYLVKSVNGIQGNKENKVSYQTNIKKAFYNIDTTQWMGLGHYILRHRTYKNNWYFELNWEYEDTYLEPWWDKLPCSPINFSLYDKQNTKYNQSKKLGSIYYTDTLTINWDDSSTYPGTTAYNLDIVLEDHFKTGKVITLQSTSNQTFNLHLKEIKDSIVDLTYVETSSLKKSPKKVLEVPENISILSEDNKNNILYINREKEYYWDLKLFGDKYDVYITDNNTFADKNSYLPSIYAANHDGVEEKQHITIEGENTYEISNIDYFKSVGKTYYRQSKGIMSGPISYYGVANGTLTYNSETDKYTVDEELRKVMSTDKVKFSMGSKYTSETYAGTICLKDVEVVVELQEATTHSQFEFGAAIALQYTIVTQASLSENLLNVVKAKKDNGVDEEGTKFTVSSDNTKQEVTAINDYFNITFTPGFKNSTSGYTSVQMTLADKDEALILPNSLTTKQVLIVVNTKGKIRIDGKKDDEIKRGTIDESLLSLIVPQETEFTLEGKTYIVRTKDKQNNSITFSTEQNKGYIVDNEQEKSLEIQLTNKYIDIASTTFDKTNLVLTLNYINTYTVDKIEEYPYSVPIDNGEKLYLVTCEEVVNPTNFEVNERSLEKEATLERQSMILTVKTTDGTALPHLLVEGDSYYDIYSNYIKSPAYYFRTLQKKPLNIIYNKKVVEEAVTINSASATFSGYCENNISYYEWELYEYYIDDYILVDKFTNKYTTNLFYDCHKLVNNTNYKLKLKVTTVEGLKIEKSVNIKVQYADDLILKNAFVERDCLRQAIAIDLINARFEYKGVTYSICPFSKELEIGVYGPVKGFYVIRTIKDEPLSATVIGFVKGFTSRFYDYSFQREETYEYSIIPVFNPVNVNGEVEQEDLIRGIAYKIKPSIRFNTQTICLIGTKTDFAEENEELQELTNCYLVDDSEFGRWYFKLNAEDKNVTVVTDKNIYENNNPFASVNQTDRNYKTGSVTVMLGNYHKTEDKQWTYKDSIRLQNKFQAFCNNGKVKMLRDEIGNVIPVDVTLKSFDYLPQAIPTIISVTFEWTQVGSEENLGVYDYRKENELDKIYVLSFDTREEVLSKPLEVQGLYFEKGKKIVPSKDITLSGQGVEYNESTGFVFLNNKAPKTEIVVTVGIKSDESIKTTFTIPAID